MARNKGQFSFSANYEVKNTAPLDARQRTALYSDLTTAATWQGLSGSETWAYAGMIVSVYADPIPANNGIYRLKEVPYSVEANWEKIGTGDVTLAYVDGSLATRDASIIKLFADPIFATSFGVGNWSVDVSGTSLCFKYNNDKKMVLDPSGNMYISGDLYFNVTF
jgi:hypothetical protein